MYTLSNNKKPIWYFVKLTLIIVISTISISVSFGAELFVDSPHNYATRQEYISLCDAIYFDGEEMAQRLPLDGVFMEKPKRMN